MVLVLEEIYNEYMAWEQRKQVNSKEDSTKTLETLKIMKKDTGKTLSGNESQVKQQQVDQAGLETEHVPNTENAKQPAGPPELQHTLSVSRDKLNIKRSGEKTKERYTNKQSGGGLPPGWIHFRQYRTPGSVKH